MSEITIVSDKGITDQPIKLKTKEITGASKNIWILELLGNIVSLTNSFNPSANGCSRPRKPITLGPLLL